MSNEEMVAAYQAGNKKALEELIEMNMGMVYRLVNKFYTEKINAMDKDDLQQEGIMGLMIAAEKYNPNHEKRAQFITYAAQWINQKIHRFIHNNGTEDELSLNAPIGNEGEAEMVDFIEGVDYSFENIEEQIYHNQLRSDLESVMVENNSLNEREILKANFGWYNNNPMSMSEVAGLFDIPEKTAISVKNKALRKIRLSKWCQAEMKRNYQVRKMNVRSIEDLNRTLDYGHRFNLDNMND